MTTTPTIDPRTAHLDPQVRRHGLFGMSRLMVIVWAIAVFVTIVIWMSVRGWSGAIIGAIILGGVALTTSQRGGEKSIAGQVIFQWRNHFRRRRGEHIYCSTADRGDRTGIPSPDYDPEADPAWQHPVPLGNVTPLDLTGTGFDSLFILLHTNPGETQYLSVMLQVEGLKGGLRSNAAYATSWQQYGYLAAELAQEGSFIRGTQQIHRSVAYDLTPHTEWYAKKLVNADGKLKKMVDSYWGLLQEVRPIAEEHRVWYIVKIPVDRNFIARASTRDSWGDGRRAEVGWASVVRDELERFEMLLRGAGMGEVTVLGRQRTCAVIRSLMDPSFALDDDTDADWESCWQSYVGGRDAVVVNGRWHTAVAHVPPGGIDPTPLGPLWLHPLLVGVAADEGTEDQKRAATIRTVSVRMDFIPDTAARAQAVQDLTSDAADDIEERQKGRIDDGTTETNMSGSKRRRLDLMPGKNIHGMAWSMWISVTGTDADDLQRACLRVSAAAGRSAIKRLKWQTDAHDVTQIATLPLARGMAGSTEARTA